MAGAGPEGARPADALRDGGGGGLGVLVAVEAEARAILDEPRFAWEEAGRGLLRSRAWPLSLALSGVGKALAARAATLLALERGTLCALGTAGALGRERVGSLWLCGEFVEHDMDVPSLGLAPGVTPFWGPGAESPVLRTMGPALRARALAACAGLGPLAGEARIASGDRFVADPALAADLAARFGARLAEMESAACAKVAVSEGIGFFSLRYVSDNADHAAGGDWAANVRRSAEVFRDFLLAWCGVG